MEPGLRPLGQDLLAGRGNCGEGIGLLARGGRRWCYLAHENGPANFSVVEVTDPRRPRLVLQTELGEEGLRSNSLAVHGDLMLVCYQQGRLWEGARPSRVGLEVFSLEDPERPRSIAFFDTSGGVSRGTHCVWFGDGRTAWLATGMPDFRPSHRKDDQLVVALDLSRPERPREAGRWWLPGTAEGDVEPPPERHPVFDSGFRPHNVNVYPARPDRAYVAYLDGGVVILDVTEVARPRQLSRLDWSPPLAGFTHTVLPLFERGLLAVTDESTRDEAQDWPKLLWLVDASTETNLVPLGTAPLERAPSPGGGRYGAHNLHENDPHELAWRSEDIVVGAFFGAGLRAYDIRNPFQPRELASFTPPAPAGSPVGTAQLNDVFVDERGVVYAVERWTGGLYLLEAGF